MDQYQSPPIPMRPESHPEAPALGIGHSEPVNPTAPPQNAPQSHVPSTVRPTREQLKAARERERRGVPFLLQEEPQGEVLIKEQTLADRSLWVGVPSGLQSQIAQAFDQAKAKPQTPGRQAARTFAEVMKDVETDEAFANAVCMAVFMEPKIVASEYELATNPGAWVVTDIHIKDRMRVLQWVMGNRTEDDLARVAEFQRRHSGLADTAAR